MNKKRHRVNLSLISHWLTWRGERTYGHKDRGDIITTKTSGIDGLQNSVSHSATSMIGTLSSTSFMSVFEEFLQYCTRINKLIWDVHFAFPLATLTGIIMFWKCQLKLGEKGNGNQEKIVFMRSWELRAKAKEQGSGAAWRRSQESKQFRPTCLPAP